MISVREVADRLGWSTQTTRRRLQALHERHGGLLFRAQGEGRSDGQDSNTKLWVDPAALRSIMPDRFAGDPTPADVLGLLERLEEVDGKATRALAEIADFRRRSKQWLDK